MCATNSQSCITHTAHLKKEKTMNLSFLLFLPFPPSFMYIFLKKLTFLLVFLVSFSRRLIFFFQSVFLFLHPLLFEDPKNDIFTEMPNNYQYKTSSKFELLLLLLLLFLPKSV